MKYLYQDLTKQMIGLCYQIYNELGYGYQEKYYQRAFEIVLQKHKIKYQRELCLPIKFGDRIIGRNIIDFLIDDKLVVEFKVGKEIRDSYIRQVLAYIKANNLKLGLIVLFCEKGIILKRIIN